MYNVYIIQAELAGVKLFVKATVLLLFNDATQQQGNAIYSTLDKLSHDIVVLSLLVRLKCNVPATSPMILEKIIAFIPHCYIRNFEGYSLHQEIML